MELLVVFVVGAIAGYGIRAYISARRRARARRDGFAVGWAHRAEGKAKPIRPHPSGKLWTEADKKQLLELVEAGKSEAEIGTVMHRTPGAVASRLKRLRRVQNNPLPVPDPDANPPPEDVASGSVPASEATASSTRSSNGRRSRMHGPVALPRRHVAQNPGAPE